jgi:hypothetical protein
MSLTVEQIGILVAKRLDLPSSERLRIQALVNAGLEKLAQRVVNDTTKRHLLLTDRTSVTSTITNTNQDYYSDLSTAQSTNAVMLDYLNYGTIYHTYATTTFTTLDKGSNYVNVSHSYPTGLKVRLSTSGTLPDELAANTDYYIINRSTSTVQFATSRANAFSGTVVDLTSDGSGTHTITPWEQETVQFLNREVGDLARTLPNNYIYGWLVGTKLFTNAQTGTFALTVPFIPTLSTLPTKLETELIDVISELAGEGDTDDE